MTRVNFLQTGIILLSFCFTSCASVPRGTFGHEISKTPDYSALESWAAHPTQPDSADEVPIAAWRDEQSTAPADVFFIHPTTYIGKSGQNQWNADIRDEKLNLTTDKSTILYQASIFNGAGRVYAPRYRQAHINCFYTKKKSDAAKALDLAYEDVRASFQYYLEHYNQGRPFIIATHSQGTFHGRRLLREFVDGKPLQKQFIVAYLAGYTISADFFKEINPCTSPEEIGCFCSWRTFKEGYIPHKLHFEDSNIVVTNPVTWNSAVPVSDREIQLGGVLRNFHTLYPGLVNTRIYEDLLWVQKPKFPGSFFLTTKNYHIADYNFFYADIRQNAQDRVSAFLRKR